MPCAPKETGTEQARKKSAHRQWAQGEWPEAPLKVTDWRRANGAVVTVWVMQFIAHL